MMIWQRDAVESSRTELKRPLRVDAHHHLWQFSEAEYGWIDETMSVLRRDYLVGDLVDEIGLAQVDTTVVVQARETIAETHWLLECARDRGMKDGIAPGDGHGAIAGVVGWVPLEAESLAEILDELADPKLVGVREIAQGKPDGFFDRQDFNRGVAMLQSRQLAYDLLIFESQLVEATRFVDRHPNQRFVLDHAAKPKITKAELEPWRTRLQMLAERPNVSCKLSGLVTEAPWRSWTPELLRPYLDACVEAFGTDRLMAGSDWPVCLVASSYSQWWSVLEEYFCTFSSDERGRIFGENAINFYDLPVDA